MHYWFEIWVKGTGSTGSRYEDRDWYAAGYYNCLRGLDRHEKTLQDHPELEKLWEWGWDDAEGDWDDD